MAVTIAIGVARQRWLAGPGRAWYPAPLLGSIAAVSILLIAFLPALVLHDPLVGLVALRLLLVQGSFLLTCSSWPAVAIRFIPVVAPRHDPGGRPLVGRKTAGDLSGEAAASFLTLTVLGNGSSTSLLWSSAVVFIIERFGLAGAPRRGQRGQLCGSSTHAAERRWPWAPSRVCRRIWPAAVARQPPSAAWPLPRGTAERVHASPSRPERRVHASFRRAPNAAKIRATCGTGSDAEVLSSTET
jgi:hypothetical protein